MTVWQQLGAFVYTGSNLTDDRLAAFKAAGGSWIAPVVYGDDVAGPWNLDNLGSLQQRAAAHGLACGGWFNGTGADPEKEANAVSDIIRSHSLTLAILDLEAQYTGANAPLMPELTGMVRAQLPAVNLGVSSYGWAVRSMIWRDFWRYNLRYLPQWYSANYQKDGHYAPDWCMADLKANGAVDPNLADHAGPSGRGLPLSYVHGTLEATGLEGSSLADELDRVKTAKANSGYTLGASIYTLEDMPDADADLALLAAQKGVLFL